ncbi:MAG TPA: hypothetical protein VKP67_28905 [Xanthobacteraceae bacterium]|nr:hypothetical protein [Xanthobacteraceae bacterium]
MDWRLIGALAAAGGSFCCVAVGAYFLLAGSPAPQRASASAPILLSEYRFPAEITPSLTSVQPASSPFASQSNVVPVVVSDAIGAGARVGTSGLGPSISPPRVIEDSNKSPRVRSEPKQEPRVIGNKTASLTPFDGGTRSEPPSRPVIELKKSAIVPEIHTALPTARYHGVLTSAEIVRIKHNLRLTADQEPAWPAVEGALAEMGRQQLALLRHGQEPRISQSDWPPGRLYSVAGPLLRTLRPDQKETVRRLCRSLGFEAIASMI